MDRNTRNIINKAQTKISSLKELTGQDRSKKFNIPFLLNNNDGDTSNVINVNKIGDLTSSSSGSGSVFGYSSEVNADKVHTAIDGLVDDITALTGKVNLIIRALKEQNIIR
jgi:hypothetical protein|tara:strand:+ start:545 stop:877 length:333 start_codon:yes stop_codon:yes gene_type:complete